VESRHNSDIAEVKHLTRLLLLGAQRFCIAFSARYRRAMKPEPDAKFFNDFARARARMRARADSPSLVDNA
jgi:hypothetical protein